MATNTELRVSRKPLNPRSLANWRTHPIEFIETVLFDPETGRPFKLLPAERAFLAHAFKIGRWPASLQRMALFVSKEVR